MPSSIVRARLRSRLGPGFSQMASVAIPPKSRRAVSGFPPLTDAVGGLPSREQDELRMLVEWVIETHMPGAFPVIGISCIGHADRDDARGRGFELDISQRRARAVLKHLESEISRLSFSFSRILGISTINPAIAFASSGVGSKFARPATNEKQRLRNRRVEIVFERGGPKPPPPRHLDFKDLFRGIVPGPVPIPRPNFFIEIDRPRKDEWLEIIKVIRKSPLKFVDLQFVVEGLVDALDFPHDPTEAQEKVIENLTDAILEEKRDREKRTLDPPGDPDEPDEETQAPPTRQREKPLQQQR
jgi:hypothetical protein